MPKPAKPHNGGQWTEARKTAFIKSALRGARWPVKYAVIRWNTFIARLYVEKDGFQAICKDCHKTKTKQENQERKRVK
jgi:hypothetical protein